ncbi:MAG: contractile injection system protein, VgrG/Pvc8 family [Lachnospiraceae bacterium]|nr:contractile injection system protein, VgrG/Pvc8 family [Lachnospiraceae bacterium]MCM1240438.1 contractile injection system protein, VgrG/Pvc8 family [Lachnospiraceae bacterium]
MSDRNRARRTEIRLTFKGVDITKDLEKYLQSMTYTDNEEDNADDISLTLDDRGSKWLTKWLNTKNATKTVQSPAKKDIAVGDIVQFKGGPVYISSMAASPTVNRGASRCKVTIKNSNAHPLHLISEDGARVYGWVNAADVEGAETGQPQQEKERKAFKGTEIHAIIIQKNPFTDGKDKVHDCGVFEIDSVDFSGPPDKLTIKATSIPYSSTLRQTKKTKVWENSTLENIGAAIAGNNGLQLMYLSEYNPTYKRKEQLNISDIVFLKNLCKGAGISLKVTSKKIVMFDAAAYEKKPEAKKLKKGKKNILSYKMSTRTADTEYVKCTVSYTDPVTKERIEATYTDPGGGGGNAQELKIEEKVGSKEEAMALAGKYLRAKNRGETTAQITVIGDVDYCAGITVRLYGYGEYDGKYIVETATHNLTGGYTTDLKLRSCLEDY